MKYATHLKKLFDNIHLSPEDLLLLESFQINYLPERVPQKEFAAVLRAYPFIQEFLVSKNASIENFIKTILKENIAINDKRVIDDCSDELIWEIADLIVYNKHPEIYDCKVSFTWQIDEIIPKELVKGKIVADVGAGSGKFAFMLSAFANTVYAIEPIGSFRTYIREKANKEKCKNIYTIDGFLDTIPLPDNSIDILFTSNAIGWNLEKELMEIERVVKPGGQAIHLMRSIENESDNPFHNTLISSDWKYDCIQYQATGGIKIKYSKFIK